MLRVTVVLAVALLGIGAGLTGILAGIAFLMNETGTVDSLRTIAVSLTILVLVLWFGVRLVMNETEPRTYARPRHHRR